MKNSSLTRVTILTKHIEAFKLGIEDFSSHLYQLIEENEISAEF